MGDCACGERDTLPVAVHNDPELVDEPDKKEKEILQARKEEARYFVAGDRQRKSFLKGSLFEKDFGDEEGIITEKKTSYNIDWDRHLEEVTEDTLLDRTPAVALDMLYTIDLPDDIDSEKLSVISDLENSDLGERAICRVVFGPTQIHFCTGAYHRLQCMFYHLAKYDYPPYRDQSFESPPETKDVPVDKAEKGHLDNNTKVRVYQLTAINPSFFIYAADHPLLATKECLLRRKAQLGKTNKAPFTDNLALQLSLDCWDSKAIVPMYPPRLNRDTSLANLPEHSCVNVSLRLMQLSSRLLGLDFVF